MVTSAQTQFTGASGEPRPGHVEGGLGQVEDGDIRVPDGDEMIDQARSATAGMARTHAHEVARAVMELELKAQSLS